MTPRAKTDLEHGLALLRCLAASPILVSGLILWTVSWPLHTGAFKLRKMWKSRRALKRAQKQRDKEDSEIGFHRYHYEHRIDIV